MQLYKIESMLMIISWLSVVTVMLFCILYLQKLYGHYGATPIDISRRSDSEMKQVVTAMAGVVDGR